MLPSGWGLAAVGLLLVSSVNAQICSNGVTGVEDFGMCCVAECGTCGGSGCRDRAEDVGLTPDDCCVARISASGVYCDDTETAPCIIGSDEVCSNGVNGVEGFGMCCVAECRTCGGSGCRNRAEAIGLTPDDCCVTRISSSGVYCDDSETAPCIIGSGNSDGVLQCVAQGSTELGTYSQGSTFQASFIVSGGLGSVSITTEDEDIVAFPADLEEDSLPTELLVVGLVPYESLGQYLVKVYLNDSLAQNTTCEATLEVVVDPDPTMTLKDETGDANSTFIAELTVNQPPTTLMLEGEKEENGVTNDVSIWKWQDSTTGNDFVMEVDSATGLPSRIEQDGIVMLLSYNETTLLNVTISFDGGVEETILNLPLDDDIGTPAPSLPSARALQGYPSDMSEFPTAAPTTTDSPTAAPTTTTIVTTSDTTAPTPAPTSNNITFSEPTPEPTTSDSTPEPTTSEPTPEPITSEPTPEPTSPEPTPEPTTSEPPQCNQPNDSPAWCEDDVVEVICDGISDEVCDTLVECKNGKRICRALASVARFCPQCTAIGCAAILTTTCIKRFREVAEDVCEFITSEICDVGAEQVCGTDDEVDDDDCEDEEDSRGGGCYGDPHLTTFDGGRYDCQGRGEFVLVEAPGADTQVQARYEPFTGFSSSVTVTTGVAAREGNSSLVQITNSLDGPVVLVDGEPYDEASGVNNGVALDVSPVKVEINFATSGLIVIASIRSSYLDLSVFAPLSLVTTGLLGNNNGVISDDWKTPVGDNITFASPSGPSVTEGTNFCTTYWCTTESSSIFTYTPGVDEHDTYNMCDEDYSAPVLDDTVPTDVLELCGDNAECTFDALVIGMEVAEATLQSAEEFQVLQEEIGGLCAINTYSIDGTPPCTACPTGEVSGSGATSCTRLEFLGLDIPENIAAAMLLDAIGGFAGPGSISRVPGTIELTEADAGSFSLEGLFIRDDGLPLPTSTSAFFYIENPVQPEDFVRGQSSLESIISDGLRAGQFSVIITDIPQGSGRLFLSIVILDPDEALDVVGPDTVFAVDVTNEACNPPLTITLEWSDAISDVDLFIIEPDGTAVNFRNTVGSVGFLDNDDISGFGPENYVVFSNLDVNSDAVIGEYQAQARVFSGPAESWRLTARTLGEVVWIEEGNFTNSPITELFSVSLTDYNPTC